MNIIGISGIDGAMGFKRKHWPGLEEREYRISQGHDSAAALIVDGKIVACVAEERISRQKHTGAFPVGAIEYCLSEGGIALADLHELVHAFDYSPYRAAYSMDPVSAELYRDMFSREAVLKVVGGALPGFPGDRVRHVNHHLAHAASAYYTSGWDECLVAVIDGMGEVHGASVYHARGGELHLLRSIPARDSIGILYSLITLHLGFDFNSDEYKIMGLAPYGDPSRFRSFFEEAVRLNGDGGFQIPLLGLNRTRDQRENYAESRAYLSSRLVRARQPDEEIGDDHRDVAAALQACLDGTLNHLCGHFGRATGLRRLALAGGVALNCTANGRLLRSGLFDDIYVQPAAGDDGAALGAALHRAASAGEARNVRMPVPYLGPAASDDAIDSALTKFNQEVSVVRLTSLEDACDKAAQLIAEGRVIAWYRGRMEYGPRALGHRSILADPGHPDMRERINRMVKMREAFRPFAPAVTQEEVDRWFDVPPMADLPYMIIIVNVREQFRSMLPAVTHVDGSARVETVSAKDNAEFHALLKAVGRSTGREMVLNTSFNVKGQPIVNTPEDAIETFLRTDIDGLFLGNILVSRA